MFLLCKHVRLTCSFNKLMMMMMMIRNAERNVDIFNHHSRSNRLYCDIDNAYPNLNINPNDNLLRQAKFAAANFNNSIISE